ncbi:MAG: ATP-binding cassette domain-containing protein [Acidobacteriota bacterium]
MLDVSLRGLTLAPLRDLDLTFPRSTHTAIVGRGGSGASTLLRSLAGEVRPERGEIRIGTRDVTKLSASRRPLLYVTQELSVPARWSVQHALVAATRGRTLDREDRHREYVLAGEKWGLTHLEERRISSLSSSEKTRVHLAWIELTRPGILVADRLLSGLNAAELEEVASAFYRTLRVLGTTSISAPATRLELGLTDSIAVLHEGRLVQHGTAAEVFLSPLSEAAAEATGEVNVIPVTIRGAMVESPIGAWEVTPAPFQGSGLVLVRPDEFEVAAPGEDSDVIFGVEEACFRDGRWHAVGMLSGGVVLRVVLPRSGTVHKGKLLALRYDPSRFRLLQKALDPLVLIPTDVVPAMRDSR